MVSGLETRRRRGRKRRRRARPDRLNPELPTPNSFSREGLTDAAQGKGIQAHRDPRKEIDRWIYTTCGYCSTGCGIEVGVKDGRAVSVRGTADHPVNRGKLCLKGIHEFEAINAPDRAGHPMIRDGADGPLRRASWDEALARTAGEFKADPGDVRPRRSGRREHWTDLHGRILHAGKLVRGGLGTNNYDGNTTLCMASAVSGYKRSFGSDGPPGCYDDFDRTECLIAFGSNLSECHPVLYYRLKTALERRRFPVIVVDPRVTMLAQLADIHLPIRPGTDVVLLNALANVILAEGMEDQAFALAHTTGFEDFARTVSRFTPEYAEGITGIPAGRIREVARIYGRAGAAMAIWTMGINQSTHGSDGVAAINNLALITGNVGKPGGSSLSITGQCNAMGTREFSSASGLPRVPPARKPRASFGDRPVLGRGRDVFPRKARPRHDRHLPGRGAGRDKGDVGDRHEPDDIHARYRPGPRNPGEARVPGRPGRLLPRRDGRPRACLPSGRHVGGEDRDVHEHGAARRPGPEGRGASGGGEERPGYLRRVGPRHGAWASLPGEWTAEKAFDEIREVSRGRLCDYSGITYEELAARGGIQWPSPSGSHGTPRLYADGLFQHADGKARLIPLEFVDDNERPDESYPFLLNTGRVIEHWHTRTKTGRIGNLDKFSPFSTWR